MQEGPPSEELPQASDPARRHIRDDRSLKRHVLEILPFGYCFPPNTGLWLFCNLNTDRCLTSFICFPIDLFCPMSAWMSTMDSLHRLCACPSEVQRGTQTISVFAHNVGNILHTRHRNFFSLWSWVRSEFRLLLRLRRP